MQMMAVQAGMWVAGTLAAAVASVWWATRFRKGLGKRGSRHERESFEHALKHLLARKHGQRSATPESLTGVLAMRPRTILDLIQRMESAGLIRSVGASIDLTEHGEEWAVQVVRAHRLWERYLVDDAGVPLHRVHTVADKAEHSWTPAALDALDAHLGHPTTDPHGDPIPTTFGRVDTSAHLALNQWPIDTPAVIVHIEDEPADQMQAIIDRGLKPGTVLNITERTDDAITFETNGRRVTLPPAVGSAINVTASRGAPPAIDDTLPLSAIRMGEVVTIAELGDDCRGLTRRRLLDMGMTPGTKIEVQLADMVGAARAYRVRETVVALRREQADLIRVRRATAVRRESTGVAAG